MVFNGLTSADRQLALFTVVKGYMSINAQLGGTNVADISGKNRQKVVHGLTELNGAVCIKQLVNTLKIQQASQKFGISLD